MNSSEQKNDGDGVSNNASQVATSSVSPSLDSSNTAVQPDGQRVEAVYQTTSEVTTPVPAAATSDVMSTTKPARPPGLTVKRRRGRPPLYPQRVPVQRHQKLLDV